MAEDLQKRFLDTLNPGSHRQHKAATEVYLMTHTDCPGILVECGFLSNPAEEANLRQRDYQQKLAAVIGTGVAEFLDSQTND